MLALVHLQFTGQAAFPWWSVVVGIVALTLLGYTVALWREQRRGGEESLAPGMPVAKWSRKFFLLVGGAAGASLLLTAGLLLLRPPHAELVAMLWTLGLGLLAVWLFYHRVYRYLGRGRMLTLLSLRLLGVLFLVLLLFEPTLAFIKAPNQRDKLAIVLDASGSMSIADQPNEPTRYRQSALAAQTLALRLAEHYDLQFFAYDGKHADPLPTADAFDALPPNGQGTDLAAAVNLAANTGHPQAILFSDGIHNAPAGVTASLNRVAIKVHTVRVGSDQVEPASVPDIAVVAIDGPPSATVNTTVTLTASIKSTAMSDRTVKVQLIAVKGQGTGASGVSAGAFFDEQRLVLRSGPTPQTVQVKFTPEKVGRMVVRVQVPVDPAERSDANNQQDFPLLVTDPKLPVLYVEGRVRPEVGRLRRALAMDPNIDAISLVQTQAGHFEISGLKKGDDLVGLPTTLAQWKRFRVVILGDLDSSFLSPQQQKDLQQAVKDGTGLLMIGGQHSFAPGGWGKTTLATLMPVDLAPVEPAQINASFVPQLTPEGKSHPVFRGIAGYFLPPDGKPATQTLPALAGCVALGTPKPGASVLAVHPSAKVKNQPATVLAVQQVGQGRAAAFAADTTNTWDLFLRAMGKDSPYNRFWGQMVRYLAGQEDLQKKSGPSVTAMIAKERYDAGEPVRLRCAVTDLQGQTTAFATVWAEIRSPDGKNQQVSLSAVPEQTGVYEATFAPTLAGNYLARFGATKDGKALGEDVTNFSVLQAAGEMDRLAAQPQTLQELAATTGGRYVDLPALETLAEQLATPAVHATVQQTSVPLFFPRGYFLTFLAALSLEWWLRRKWQLQ